MLPGPRHWGLANLVPDQHSLYPVGQHAFAFYIMCVGRKDVVTRDMPQGSVLRAPSIPRYIKDLTDQRTFNHFLVVDDIKLIAARNQIQKPRLSLHYERRCLKDGIYL